MLYPTGAQIPFVALFTNSKAGVTGLTVTVSVVRLNTDGTRTTVISQASNTAATELDATNAKGLYGYLLPGANTGTAGAYLATFHTAGTVDQADVPALEIVGPAWVQNSSTYLDAAITSRQPSGAVALQANQHVIADTIPSVQSDVTAGLTAQGYTTTRAGYLDTLNGLVQAIWDKATSALTAVGSIGKLLVSNVDAAISSRNAVAPDNASIGAILSRTDVATSTRLASSSYSAPLTAGQVENAVWDAVASSHSTSGSTGSKLNSAASSTDPWSADLPGSYTGEQAGAIFAHLRGGTIYTSSPVWVGLNLEVVKGDSYTVALGRSIDWYDSEGIWPDLTGATVTFTVGTLSVVGTVVTPTGSPKHVRVELTAAQTAALDASKSFLYSVRAALGADTVTLARGALVVKIANS